MDTGLSLGNIQAYGNVMWRVCVCVCVVSRRHARGGRGHGGSGSKSLRHTNPTIGYHVYIVPLCRIFSGPHLKAKRHSIPLLTERPFGLDGFPGSFESHGGFTCRTVLHLCYPTVGLNALAEEPGRWILSTPKCMGEAYLGLTRPVLSALEHSLSV